MKYVFSSIHVMYQMVVLFVLLWLDFPGVYIYCFALYWECHVAWTVYFVVVDGLIKHQNDNANVNSFYLMVDSFFFFNLSIITGWFLFLFFSNRSVFKCKDAN